MNLVDKYVTVYQSQQIVYFLIPFEYDCIICLSFHRSPRILRCGHIFCSLCLEDCIREYKICPECKSFITNSFQVRWEIVEDINLNDEILLRKGNKELLTCDIQLRREFPFCRKYFIEEDKPRVNIQIVNEYLNIKKGTGNKGRLNNFTQKVIDYNLQKRKIENALEDVYYQSNDGQLYFLDDYGIKYLKKRYGCFETMPEYLLCKVMSVIKCRNNKKYKIKHLNDDLIITWVHAVLSFNGEYFK